jgi:hypothetical protein
MESRLIYESDKTFLNKTTWEQEQGSESEWHYFELKSPRIFQHLIQSFFDTRTVHIVYGRQDSFTEEKTAAFSRIELSIGTSDIRLWDENFIKVIEISRIGVYRAGFVK